jgi:predicted RNA-binding Zn-ribbon protein involved in translation (DUF1610 family)
MELEAAFSTEAACRDYLARLRWPNGFRCPHCGDVKSWPVRGVLFQCANCDGNPSRGGDIRRVFSQPMVGHADENCQPLRLIGRRWLRFEQRLEDRESALVFPRLEMREAQVPTQAGHLGL